MSGCFHCDSHVDVHRASLPPLPSPPDILMSSMFREENHPDRKIKTIYMIMNPFKIAMATTDRSDA